MARRSAQLTPSARPTRAREFGSCATIEVRHEPADLDLDLDLDPDLFIDPDLDPDIDPDIDLDIDIDLDRAPWGHG